MSAEDADEKPLDPAVARVQARLQRLMLIAGLTLGIGLLAVFGGIVWRLSSGGAAPPKAVDPGRLVESAVDLPDGARLATVKVIENRVVFAFTHAGGTTVIFVDPKAGAVVGRLDLRSPAAE